MRLRLGEAERLGTDPQGGPRPGEKRHIGLFEASDDGVRWRSDPLRDAMANDASIHLCQPDNSKSCAACCGIYNYADSSREALAARLWERTERYHREVRGPADLKEFSRATRATEDQAKRFEVIHCCEFAGFLDERERRVGCLLHPAQNGGADLRGVSFYGRELCEGHLCPSDHFLSRTEKIALIDVIDDWYLYGLCLTDIDLVKEYFRHVGDRLGEALVPGALRGRKVRVIARRFFEFKADWPFRSLETNRFGRFYFDGSQHMIRWIDYEAIGCTRSPFDAIFLSLASGFRSADELREAEGFVGENIEALAAALRERAV